MEGWVDLGAWLHTEMFHTQGFYRLGKTRKSQGICVVREKNIIFEKSGKMILDHADCRYLWFLVSQNIKMQANLRLPLNVQKLEVFQLQGASLSWPSTTVLCRLHNAPLIIQFYYFTIYCTISDICVVGLLFR